MVVWPGPRHCPVDGQYSPYQLHLEIPDPAAMAFIAVAGGTGGVGRTILEELLRQKTLDIVVLTRSVVPNQKKRSAFESAHRCLSRR